MNQDTGKAQLPGLPRVNTGNPALDRWIVAVTERLEVREGTRGNPAEQVVLQRDMRAMGLSGPPLHVTGSVGGAAGDILVARPDGTYARLSVDAFGDAVRRTSVYKELIRSIDDPNRFDDVPVVVRELLQSSLADEAQKRGADIRLLESKQQSDTDSLAYTVKTVTAAVGQAAAGIRELDYASADANRATAGRFLTLQSRINNFSPDGLPGTATLEQMFKTVADKTTGLEASYFLKVQVDAGGKRKIAGFGISATSDPTGAQNSAFIVLADKFAVVTPSDVISDPLNPPADRIPFGVDASGVFINGKVRINTGGQTIESVGRRLSLSADSTVFKVNAAGTPSPNSVTLTATLSGGLVGTPTFTVAEGTASLSGSGLTRTLAYSSVGTDRVIVRASVTMEDTVYNTDLLIYRAFDGVQGVRGVRGSVTRYGSLAGGSAWNSTDFSTADGLVGVPQVIGDTVTLSSSSAAVTKYWSGYSWVDPGVVIDGNLLVNGTLSADKIAAGTIIANLIIKSSGYIWADGTNWTAGSIAAGYFNSSGNAIFGVNAIAGLAGAGVQGTAGVTGYYGVTGVGTTLASVGVFATHQNSDGTALRVTGKSTFDTTIVSSPAAGTAPLTTTSTTVCTNLNADLLDGQHATDFAAAAHSHGGLVSSVSGNVGSGAPSGGALIFSCTIPGFRFRVSGNMAVLESTP